MKLDEYLPPLPPHDNEIQPKQADKPTTPDITGNVKGRFQDHHTFIVATQRTLNRTEALAWLTLWDYTNAKTGLCQLSYKALSEQIGCSSRAIQDAIKGLMKRGLVKRLRKGSKTTHESAVYQVIST